MRKGGGWPPEGAGILSVFSFIRLPRFDSIFEGSWFFLPKFESSSESWLHLLEFISVFPYILLPKFDNRFED